MNRRLSALLAANDHVASRRSVLASVSDHVLEHAIRTGAAKQLMPNVYVSAEFVADVRTRERAALLYAGPQAALSHVSALRRWGLPVPSTTYPVHVTVPAYVRRRGRPHVVTIHRTNEPARPLVRGGLPITPVERSIVDSWPLLSGADQRAPAIAAVTQRLTTPQRLMREALTPINLKGRASLLAHCWALVDGCRSELELWGLRHVFADKRFAHGVRQLPVQLGAGVVYLDLAFERERVNVELDGAAYHVGRGNRERDMRRDAALAALGWVVLRFSYQRMHEEPEAVRAEVAIVLEMRRRQLAA